MPSQSRCMCSYCDFKRNAEFGCKSVEENAVHKANNAELVVTKYLGATSSVRDWYNSAMDWLLMVTQKGSKNSFGWAPYVELPEEVTATVLAQGKPAKCKVKQDNQKALRAKIDNLERINAELKNKLAQYKKKKVNGERGYEAADRELEQKLLDAQTELEECADDLQELKDRVGAHEHQLRLQNTKISDLEGQLQEKTTQNRLDAANIENLRERLTESKKEVEYFKTLQYPPPTPTGAHVYESASMSLKNTVSPPI